MTAPLRLPPPPERYDRRNEAETRRSLELADAENLKRADFIITRLEWNPGPIASGGTVTADVDAPGAQYGDPVLVGFAGLLSDNVQLTAHVRAPGSVRVLLQNHDAVPLDPEPGTLTVIVWKVA